MKKKYWSLGIIFLLILSLLAAGCGGDRNGQDETDEGNQVEMKELVVGTNTGFIPFEFLEGDEIVGFDIDLANEIADFLGVELRIEDMDFDGLIAAVASGRIDMAIAGITIDEKRKESVNFSEPYFTAVQAIVVMEDNEDIKSEKDLADKKVGVQLSTTGDFTVSDLIDDEQITRLNHIPLLFEELKNGRVDAVVIDLPVAEKYISLHGGMKMIEGDFEEEYFGIAIAKENEELLAKVNQALAQLKADGTYDRLIRKWFEETVE